MALRLKLDNSANRNTQPADPDDRRAELTEHLAELRTRLIRSCLYCAAGMILMWLFSEHIANVMFAPINDALKSVPKDVSGLNGRVVFNSFAEAFFLKMQVCMVGGLILAIPFVMMELWGFIEPALTEHERKGVLFVAPMSILLFIGGVACAFFIMPMALKWFLSYMQEIPGAILLQNPLTYIVFFVKLMLVFGVMFQLPVVLMFLGKVGIITSKLMKTYWRQAAVGIFTAAMVVAPSNDPGTMLALAIPLTILFLASIWLVKLVEPKNAGA